MRSYELHFRVEGDKYILEEPIVYNSPRYRKTITCEAGMESDGATGGEDIVSRSWWVHDKAKERKTWDDGTELTNWQASYIIHDILESEGRWWRAQGWGFWTWVWGVCRGYGMCFTEINRNESHQDNES